tara:strand:+ start:958 stop:1980 length:1023 start_codon:yes stop_codon:yes gene_type:complete
VRTLYVTPLVIVLALSWAKPTSAEDSAAKRFASSSVLIEHAFSVGHVQDLSPLHTRSFTRSLRLWPSYAINGQLNLSAQLGLFQELTVTDTTYAFEPMLDDLMVSISQQLPRPKAAPKVLNAAIGLDLFLPTSKASQAASLITAIEPWFQLSATAPVLDGLEFSYRVTPGPRLHRYTTASFLVERPCSPATGCSLGATVETGERNPALQLHNDFSLTISALNSKLSLSAQLRMSYGFLYPKSPSGRYDEVIISNPGNNGGNPVRANSTFIFDLNYQVHPGLGLSMGLWTPGGMRPDGDWYNPLGNRFSQVYIDLILYPVALVRAEMNKKRSAETARPGRH